MMMIRYYVVGPSRRYVDESRRGHERVVEGWRRAVEAAEKAQDGGYWPVHLNGESCYSCLWSAIWRRLIGFVDAFP